MPLSATERQATGRFAYLRKESNLDIESKSCNSLARSK